VLEEKVARVLKRVEAGGLPFHLMNAAVAAIWVYRAVVTLEKIRDIWKYPDEFWTTNLKVQVGMMVLFLFDLLVLAVLYICRRRSTETAADVPSLFFAHLATWLPMVGYTGGTPLAPGVALPCFVAMTISAFVSLLGFLSLGRSWGIIPANRGVRTGGLYRIVRHPIYASYLVTYGAYTLAVARLPVDPAHPGVVPDLHYWNLAVYAIFAISTVARTYYEERVLRRDPSYAEFAEKTRARLIPFVL
jgi:protein-S-isoprenylcysteine O-methyltransferase Ste14